MEIVTQGGFAGKETPKKKKSLVRPVRKKVMESALQKKMYARRKLMKQSPATTLTGTPSSPD